MFKLGLQRNVGKKVSVRFMTMSVKFAIGRRFGSDALPLELQTPEEISATGTDPGLVIVS